MVYQTIAWHQECNDNMKKSIEGLFKKRDSIIGEIQIAEKIWDFRNYQISTAIAKKKESFDDEKFLKKKEKK